MSMPAITHYWSVVKLTDPRTVLLKTDDGQLFWGRREDSGFVISSPCVRQKSFLGYNPDTHEFGFPLGEWIPVEMWRDR